MYYLSTREGLEAFREHWKKVGTRRRGPTGTCGVCGCKSNLWVTVGSVMLGIKEVLACPGKRLYPDLHEKISDKQDLLWEDKLPESVKQEISAEVQALLGKFASVEPDIKDGEPEQGQAAPADVSGS